MPIFKIIATQIGNDAGPFTIKNNLGQVIATGVTRLQLLNGYSFNVAAGITSVTLESTGNCTNSTTFTIPNEGFWEMEKNNIEEVSDHYGAINTNYSGPVETFVADDIVGIYLGVVSGTTWLIKGTPEAIAGTTYNGGGLLIVTNNHTKSGVTTIEQNANVQLGWDKDTLKGQIPGAMTLNGTLTMYGAYTTATQPVGTMTMGATGLLNIEGSGEWGEGYINAGTVIGAVGSVINLKNSYSTVNNGPFNGTINVLDGATLKSGAISGTVNLNSCTGGHINASGVQAPNIEYTGAGWAGGTINVGTCGGRIQGGTNMGGTLTGTGPLQIGVAGDAIAGVNFSGTGYTGTATVYGSQVRVQPNALENAQVRVGQDTLFYPFGATTMTYIRSLQSTNEFATTGKLYLVNGPLTIKNQDPEPFYGTFVGNGVDILTIQDGNFQIAATTSTSWIAMVLNGSAKVGGHGGSALYNGPVTFNTANTGLSLLTKPSKLTVTAFSAPSGFKVDIGANYASSPGTYTILTRTSGTNVIPTVGTNLSGLTASFSWVGNDLKMILV
jgi:hypothetical protein